MRREQTYEGREHTGYQEGMYQLEHWASWLMLGGAIALGAIGVLRGFDIIGGTTASDLSPNKGAFWDAMLFFIPGMSAAFLAYSWHQSDHHRLHTGTGRQEMRSGDMALWMGEHSLAWLVALGSIALSALGMLVGLKVFDEKFDQSDGLLWAIPGLGAAILTAALHAVRHHQVETEEDYIVRIVEQRVGMPGATPRTTPGTAPGSSTPPV